jgi:hypothetical protein
MALTIPNTFTTGETALASEVNANFQAVKTEVDLKIANALLTTKGDIIAASAASTPARLGVGTNGQLLVADSAATNGVAWGQVAAAGIASDAVITVKILDGAVTNAKTTAASANTASAIVARDASGNFAAGTITATLAGNVTGNVTGTASGNLVSGGALGTPSSGNLANCSFPTLNQNTTGSAGSVPYSGLTGGVPTWNQNTTGNAATADNATSAGSATVATTALQGAGDVAINPSGQTGNFSESGGGTYTMAFTSNNGRFWGGALVPRNNNATNLGSGTLRWQTIFSQNVLNVSDARLKKEITPTDLGLEFVNKLNPVSYKWIEGGYLPVDETDPEQVANKIGLPRAGVRKHYGLIAQELKATLDELNVEDFAGYVQDDLTDPDSTLSISYNNLLAPMIKSIQELSNKIDSLTTRINALEQ